MIAGSMVTHVQGRWAKRFTAGMDAPDNLQHLIVEIYGRCWRTCTKENMRIDRRKVTSATKREREV